MALKQWLLKFKLWNAEFGADLYGESKNVIFKSGNTKINSALDFKFNKNYILRKVTKQLRKS